METIFGHVNAERTAAGQAAIGVPNISYDGVDDGRTLLALTNTMFGNQPGNHNDICLRNNDRGKIQPSFGDYNLPALLNNSDAPTADSILAAIRSGDFVIYENGEGNYGGEPDAGFACKGFVATGVPVDFAVAAR